MLRSRILILLILTLSYVESQEVLNKTVIKKCCPAGKHLFKNSMKCRTPNIKWKNMPFPNIPVYRYIDNNFPEKTDKKLFDVYEIEVPVNESFGDMWHDFTTAFHTVYLSDSATLIHIVPNEYKWLLQINRDNFCVDLKLVGKSTPPGLVLISHLGDGGSDYDPMVVTIGFLISSFFLMLVLVVYCLLPELRNLGGRVLMAYVASLSGAFLIMGTMRLQTYEKDVCYVLTTITYFLFMSSFCWMNVMSIDIWWTFRGYAKARPIHRRGETFKFLIYCLYAFGLPAVLTAVVLTMDFIDVTNTPWIVIPGSTRKGCFFGEDGKFFYLYVPMLILILSNWALFMMTAYNIWRLHRNTSVLDSAEAGSPAAHRTQRSRLLVYLKLSIIMGINWVLEVVSSTYPDFKGWYISDAYNLLMGFFIFLIFVCKKNILRKLVKRFKGDNEWQWRRNLWVSKSGKSVSSAVSASSHTSDSDIGAEMPLQVCHNPNGASVKRKTSIANVAKTH